MERAIYALAAAVLLHAGATYWGDSGRYAMSIGPGVFIQDTRTGQLWVNGEPESGSFDFHEIAFDRAAIDREGKREREARLERFRQRLANQPAPVGER